MPLILLPFLGSGFVPTDSTPTALRWFAGYQSFTPVMETVRGLLLGTPIGNSAAIAWPETTGRGRLGCRESRCRGPFVAGFGRHSRLVQEIGHVV